MTIAWFHRQEKSRFRAVFLCLAYFLMLPIAGCAGIADTPVLSTFAAFFPSDEDVSARAAEIPFASIKLTVTGRGGLLVLSEKSDDVTFWQTSGSQAIVLKNGYLDSTSGLPSNLDMTLVSPKSADGNDPVSPWVQPIQARPYLYAVTRSWSDGKGDNRSDRASARLDCRDALEAVQLPLATLSLQRCDETLIWSGGNRTSSTIWRSPDDHRIWAVNTVPWPGGPEIEWSVARPWW